MAIQYKTNDIFRSGDPGYLNACVGKNGGPYTFHAYSLGYFDAARILVQAAIDQQISVDLGVYPITYNYRHAIELALKHLGDLLPQIWNESIPNCPTHDLRKLWDLVRPYLQRDTNFDDGKTIAFMDTFLADITQFDASAEVFRFPSDKSGNFYLQDVAHINLLVLGENMEVVREIFGTWFLAAEVLLEMKRQMDSALNLIQDTPF
jgi:hypothetical protein